MAANFYRNYDQTIGRFLAVDPMADATSDMSVYQYGNNNPVMFNDPMGDLSQAQLDAAIALISNSKNSKNASFQEGVPDMLDMSDQNAILVAIMNGANGGTTAAYESAAASYNANNSAQILSTINIITQTVNIRRGESNASIINKIQNAANQAFDQWLNPKGIIKDAGQNVDSRTLGGNLFWTNYIGPWNPKSNNGGDNYQIAPVNLADWGGMRHDLRYDKLGIKGSGGVFFSTRAISADKELVGYEFGLFINPINGATMTERIEGLIVAQGIGIAIAPKILNNATQNVSITEFPGL